MNVLLISPDLMIQSRVAAAAERASVRPPRVVGWQDALSLADAASYRLVLVDLAAPGLDVGRLVSALRERLQPSTCVVAFGPHVHTDKLAAAREAGCDRVLSRGQFDRDVDAILKPQ